jgi:class 3 adenylate cyclase
MHPSAVAGTTIFGMASALRTYVFTNLRGYGEVLRTGDVAAAQLLRAYRRVIRSAVPPPPAATEQEAVADTFHVAFRSPGRAVQTAMEIVKAIEDHNGRTRTGPILRVGIGIHAGETIREGRDFVGSAIEVAMRLSHAAQPGQILITETIHGLLRTANIGPMEDLGVWGPHGFGQTVHVYEVQVPGHDRSALRDRPVARRLLTVLFTDIVRSTDLTVELGDHDWAALVERHHAVVRSELRRWDGQEVDTAGDGFFATFDSPSRAIGCALGIRDALRAIGLEIRAGIHVGECEIVAGKVGGIAVVVGARIREAARPGEVLLSQTVKDVVSGGGFVLAVRGARVLKGIPGRWTLYAASPDSS